MADNLTEIKSEYRCETCKKLCRISCPYYFKIERGLMGISYDSYVEFTSIVGCLSHSDIAAWQPDNNNQVPNSKELTLLAETDWHNREERKHQYEMIPWTMGWMTGFLSERKPYWPKVHEAAVRKDEREKVLSIINEENNARLKGLEILFATPADKRAELAQDVYLKEAYFELTLVKRLIESLRPTTPTQEPPHGP